VAVASIYDLKPRFQALLRPVLGHLRRCGVTPNGLTLAAFGVSLATGVALLLAVKVRLLLLLVPLSLFLRMALNALDGMMAREFRMTSPLGEVLNELGDIASDVAVTLPLAAHASSSWPVIMAVMLALVNEFAGVLGVSVCGRRLYDGPMGKSDRAFCLGLVTLLLWRYPGASTLLGPYCIVISLLLLRSTFNRVRSALAHARLTR
jgi:CDP-diacylglycerol--glycerol-3-phosphate 3-phosphatidyltransferase